MMVTYQQQTAPDLMKLLQTVSLILTIAVAIKTLATE